MPRTYSLGPIGVNLSAVHLSSSGSPPHAPLTQILLVGSASTVGGLRTAVYVYTNSADPGASMALGGADGTASASAGGYVGLNGTTISAGQGGAYLWIVTSAPTAA